MNWKLIEVGKTEWIQDDSGYYALINWIDGNVVRLDWMDKNDMPVVSYQGTAENVRKYAMQKADRFGGCISLEHASYIGRELTRAAFFQVNYVQD